MRYSLLLSTFILTVSSVASQEVPVVKKDKSPWCASVYRTDRMETWNVRAGSPLCTISHPSWSMYQYGLQVKDGTLYVVSKGVDAPLADFYTSDKESYTFSASVYRPGLEFANFITIVPTADQSKHYRFEYILDDTDKEANFRSILYVGYKDIVREGQSLLFLFQLVHCSIMGFALFLIVCKDGLMLFLPPFMVITMVGVSFASGIVEWADFYSFLTYYAIIMLVGIIAGYLNNKYGNGLICAMSAIITTLYYFAGGSQYHRWGIIFSVVVYGGFAVFLGYFNSYGNPAEKINFVLQFSSFWLQQFEFWSYAFMIFPAELYMRAFHGPGDYPIGYSGIGIYISWRVWVTFFAFLGLQMFTIYMKFGTQKINLQGSREKSVI